MSEVSESVEHRVAAAIMRAYFSRPVDEQIGINVCVTDQLDLARAALEEIHKILEGL